MKKVILDMGKISKGMRLKFGLILSDNEIPNQKFNNKIINVFNLSGNEYIKISPHPFITLDISSSFDKNEDWSNNKSVTLNNANKMKFENSLLSVIKSFQVKNMFYYDNHKKLMCDDNISKKNMTKIIIGNKTCIFRCLAIPDENNKEVNYEGVIMMVNSVDNFCYLSFEEVNVLLYSLKNINMYSMSISLMNLVQSHSDLFPEKIETSNEIIKEEIEEVPEPNKVPPISTNNSIPDFSKL